MKKLTYELNIFSEECIYIRHGVPCGTVGGRVMRDETGASDDNESGWLILAIRRGSRIRTALHCVQLYLILPDST